MRRMCAGDETQLIIWHFGVFVNKFSFTFDVVKAHTNLPNKMVKY